MSRVARQVIGHTVLWLAAALLVVGWGAAWAGPSGPGAVVRAAAAGPSAAVPGISLPPWPEGWSRPHFLGVDVSPLRPWLAAAQGAPEDARPDDPRFGATERAAGAGERGGVNTSGAAELVWVAGSSLDTLSLWAGRWDPARAGRTPWALRNPRKLASVPQISAPPSVARDAQGRAYVAWCEKEGAGASVRLQPLRAGGGPPATLLRRDWPIESASLARDGQGRLWLVWLEWPGDMAVFAAPVVEAPAGRPQTLGQPVRVARSQQVLRLPKAAALGAVPARTAQTGTIAAPGPREESALVVAWVQGHSLLAAAVWRDRASDAWQVSPAATLGEAWDKDETGPVVLSAGSRGAAVAWLQPVVVAGGERVFPAVCWLNWAAEPQAGVRNQASQPREFGLSHAHSKMLQTSPVLMISQGVGRADQLVGALAGGSPATASAGGVPVSGSSAADPAEEGPRRVGARPVLHLAWLETAGMRAHVYYASVPVGALETAGAGRNGQEPPPALRLDLGRPASDRPLLLAGPGGQVDAFWLRYDAGRGAYGLQAMTTRFPAPPSLWRMIGVDDETLASQLGGLFLLGLLFGLLLALRALPAMLVVSYAEWRLLRSCAGAPTGSWAGARDGSQREISPRRLVDCLVLVAGSWVALAVSRGEQALTGIYPWPAGAGAYWLFALAAATALSLASWRLLRIGEGGAWFSPWSLLASIAVFHFWFGMLWATPAVLGWLNA